MQRAFLKACMEQWLRLSNISNLYDAAKQLQADSLSNLTTGNYIWIGMTIFRCGIGDLVTETLPGHADMIGGVSYYLLHGQEIADLINDSFNPFTVPVTEDDLEIAR